MAHDQHSDRKSDRLRIMVIDGSAMHRRSLVDALATHPTMQLIGTAISGDTALAKLASYAPDVIAIDMATEDLGGTELAQKIQGASPSTGLLLMARDTASASAIKGIAALAHCTTMIRPADSFGSEAGFSVFASAVTEAARKSHTTVAATAPGANRPQPSAPPQPQAQAQAQARATTAPTRPAPTGSRPAVADGAANRHGSPAKPPQVVVIGCSTGGPNALAKMLPSIPEGFHLPVVIVQHMPEGFTASLAESLDRACPLHVMEAKDGQTLQAGQVLIAPGGKHLGFTKVGTQVSVVLSTEAPEHSCRPAVDYTMRSIANVFGNRTLAVIMTGMGEDGLAGCRLLHSMGAQVIAQDKDSCTVYGMPRGPVEQGLTTIVAPLDQLAASIMRLSVRASA